VLKTWYLTDSKRLKNLPGLNYKMTVLSEMAILKNNSDFRSHKKSVDLAF